MLQDFKYTRMGGMGGTVIVTRVQMTHTTRSADVARLASFVAI